jgi:hypothetical protein
MSERPTPETDAKLLSFDTFNGIDPWKGERFIKVVPANFARKLERERDEARDQRDRLAEAVERIEEIFVDGCDTYEDWKAMGEIARLALAAAKGGTQ